MRREYPRVNPVTVSTVLQDTWFHNVAVPCVQVEIPQQDWNKIVQLIEAHERALKNPAVQDAWDQYVMLTHLTKT